MGLRILRLRHRAAPETNGCRWCGFSKHDHANRWVPGRKWHEHAEPTDAQRKARYKAGARLLKPAPLRVPTIVTNLASDARTRVL